MPDPSPLRLIPSPRSLAQGPSRDLADAATVEIELAFRDNGWVQLHVRDDGKGVADDGVGTGFGLKGIRERAEQLKGTATYRTAPREGFTLDLRLPA